MNLAHGYLAQTLQTHDELLAARINEQRRVVADRRAEAGERDGDRPSLLRRLNQRVYGHGAHGARTAH